MFCEMCALLSLTVIYIICVVIACSNRGKNHIILRRLGVKDMSFWLVNGLTLFIPTLISCVLCALVWHYSGLMPFNTISLDFALFEMTLVALLMTSSSLFLACILGRSNIASIVCSCFLALFTIIVPGILHMAMFQGKSIFDPSIVPQWVIWFFMVIFPPFTNVCLLDSMTSTISDL